MTRKRLAAKLLLAETGKERMLLLAGHRSIADSRLAWMIKELCYAAWTSEPTKARRASLALASLYKLSSTDEIKALSLWVGGISDITKGKLESAVANLNGASHAFLVLGREHDSAQPRVAELMGLAMLGRYDEALRSGADALKIFEKYGDELAAGKIEMNLSNIVARRELHRESINYCLSARKRFTKLGELKWLAMSENDLARSYAQINDFRKAERFYSQALTTARQGNMLLTQAEIEASMGNMALFRGKYADALKFLELSRRKYDDLKMPQETAIADLEMADIYGEINLAEEAFAIYESVIGSLRGLKMRREEALARANYARTAAVLGKTTLARREFRKADKLFAAQKNPTAQAHIRLELAFLELAHRNYQLVLDTSNMALKMLGDTENLRGKLTATWLKAEALAHLGFAADAASILLALHKMAKRAEQVNIVEAALNSLGKLALRAGDLKNAAAYFRKAIKTIENSRSPFAAEQFRRSFMARRLEPFENLVRVYLLRGRFKDAFAAVEKFRSRTLLESLLDETSKPVASQTSKHLAAEAARLREELNWLYRRQSDIAGGTIAEAQEKIIRLEKQLADLTRQIESTETGDGRFGKDGQIPLAELQDQIGPKRAIVEYIKLDGKFSAFVITDKVIHLEPDLCSEDEIVKLLEALRFQFEAMRYGNKMAARFADQIKARADIHLHKLSEKLLKPIKGKLGERHLVIVPAASLHYVPFHALHDGSSYLIESREVQYAPSASVWHVLDKKPKTRLRTALLMGFADEHIPLVNEEIKALAEIFRTTRSFTGAQSTFSAYLKYAPKFDVLHLACHAQFRPENPMFSSLHLSDGWVTVRDICGQHLRAGLVTLSACETGLSNIYLGEEILGLARGFMSAGANSLVVSLWKVNDAATGTFMRKFYENLQRGDTIGASLRSVQRDFISRGEHPYFWSPFVFIGA